jgi:hypothetical protein
MPSRSFAVGVSILSPHVSDVVSGCPEKQVIGTYAGRVVAPVADNQPIGDRSEVYFPRAAMSNDAIPANGESAVAVGGVIALPLPAAFGPLDLMPEFAIAVPGAETPPTFTDLIGTDEKVGTAAFADAGHGTLSRHSDSPPDVTPLACRKQDAGAFVRPKYTRFLRVEAA